jgi:hypothetical protein
LPSTGDARGGCQALGGSPTWSPAGLSVFTHEGGWCSYMKPYEAMYLAQTHNDTEVEEHFGK